MLPRVHREGSVEPRHCNSGRRPLFGQLFHQLGGEEAEAASSPADKERIHTLCIAIPNNNIIVCSPGYLSPGKGIDSCYRQHNGPPLGLVGIGCMQNSKIDHHTMVPP